MRTRILSNFSWLVADRMLRLVGGLLIGAWMARYLGPAQFGLLNYVLAFVAIFAAVARLGMDELAVREMTSNPEKTPVLLGTLLGLKLMAALLALLLIMTTAFVAHSGDAPTRLLVAVVALGVVFNVLDVYDLHFQALTASQSVVRARALSFFVFSLVRIAFILTEQPLLFFAAATTLEIALGGGMLAWLHWRQFGRMRWRFDSDMMLAIWKDGWPLVLSSALIVIHTRIDQVMLGQMLGTVEVGIYSAAIRLSESWLFVPIVLVQSVTPYLLKLASENPAFYQVRLMQLYSLVFWMGVVVGLATLVCGEFFIVLLFGEAFRDAFWPLVLVIWTGIFISHGVARGVWLVKENLQHYRLVTNLIAVPVNMMLNYLLIPHYGPAGAALASLLSIGGSTWLLPFLFERMRESSKQLLLSTHPRYLFVSAQ